MTKKEGYMRYQVRRDQNLKRLSENSKKKLKKRRAKYRLKQKKIAAQAKQQATKQTRTKRNYKSLSKGQQKRVEKKYKKLERTRRRLRYKYTGGTIGFENVLKEGNWINNFVSSNVRQFRVRGDNLLIQFIDGSIYMYFGVAKMFLGLLNVGSKGKWVWKQLIRKNVNYIKIR